MSRFVISATWDNACHLTEESKAELWASIPEYQRDARSRGIPTLGAGSVYPFAESGIRVDDFEIPSHWRRCFGLDCALSGTTAAVWLALDPESQIAYVTSVYKRSQAETAVHADAVKSRGAWIPGVADAADVLDHDRTQFLTLYRRHGLTVDLPDKSVETGVQTVYDMLSAGKLKVFKSCTAWFEEFRLYRRDEKGRIVKERDHLMDAMRYAVRSGLGRARTAPRPKSDTGIVDYYEGSSALAWMR